MLPHTVQVKLSALARRCPRNAGVVVGLGFGFGVKPFNFLCLSALDVSF